jgi:ribose transport system permease protein
MKRVMDRYRPGPAPSGDATLEAPGSTGPSANQRVYDVLFTLLRIGPGLILILLFVAMTFASPYFLTERNLQNLGNQSAIVAALALGQLLVIVTRGIDVSVGSSLALSGVVGIAFGTLEIANGASVIVVILLTGVIVGALNAFFIVKGRLPQPLIVTLATLGIARGVALLLTDGEIRTDVPAAVKTAGTGFIGPIPLPVLLVAALAGVLYVLATRTRWGRWIYATGGNPTAAKELGLPVDRIQMSVYVVSGLCVGFAAVLSVGRTGSASPFAGTGLELDAITAVIIGGASLFGGRGSVGGVLVGALILGTIRNGLDLLSVSPYWQTIALGAIVLLALELDMIRGRLEQRLQSTHAGGDR